MSNKKFWAMLMAAVLLMSAVLTGCSSQTAPSKEAKQDEYPTKPISFIVQYAAGGSSDMLARALASVLPKYLGQPVVVVDKPGGSGTIGTNYALKQKPDGYNILLSSTGPFTTIPLTQDVPYDPLKDAKYVINISEHPILLVVPADAPWKTLEEFIADVKAKPGKIVYGQNSPGGTTHMAMEMFRKAAGLDMKMIPYATGAADVVAALLGKHVDVGVLHPQEAGDNIKAGKLRALVVFSDKKISMLPNVPTAKEKGLDVVVAVPKGICVPAGTPDAIVSKLHDAVKKAMEDPDYKAVTKQIGEDNFIKYMPGQDLEKFMKDLYVKMEPLVKELGLSTKKN